MENWQSAKKLTTYIIFFLALLGQSEAHAQYSNSNSANAVQLGASMQKTLQQALISNNINLFADQFTFPVTVHLHPSQLCSRTIYTRKELIENFTAIYNKQAIANMIALKNMVEPFDDTERSSVGIFGGGLYTSSDKAPLKINVINAHDGATLSCDKPPYGELVKPVNDKLTLNKIIALYNAMPVSGNGFRASVSKLYLGEYSSDAKAITLNDGAVGSDGSLLLYKADLMNDGHEIYILTDLADGDIAQIWMLNKNKLTSLIPQGLTSYVEDQFKLKTDPEAHDYFSKASILRLDNKYVLAFDSGCYYSWKKEGLSLVFNSTKYSCPS